MSKIRLMTLFPLMALPLFALLMAYPDGPDPRTTGGFGEESCRKCHEGPPLDSGRSRGGIFRIEGVPRQYEAGTSYPLKVVIGQPGQSRWGFQLSARFADSGRQAGTLVRTDSNTQVEIEGDVEYLMHTQVGTRSGHGTGPFEFPFNWTAPDGGAGLVLFNATGNAADNSGDETGDFIYSAGEFSQPGSGASAPLPSVPTVISGEAPERTRRSESPVLVNMPIPLDRKKGAREFHVQHRFFNSITSGIGGAFGADSGANINLGVDYSFTDWLTAGVSRARFDKIIAFTGTYEIHQDDDSFWAMDLHGGVEGRDNFQEHYSPSLMLATSFDFDRFRVYATPMVVFNSRPDFVLESRAAFVNIDDNHTFSLGLGADLAITPRFSLMGEAVPRLAGYGGLESRDRVSWSGGVKIRTWGHIFSIFVARSRDFTPGMYAISANRSDNEVSLGFNIYRTSR